MINIKTIVKQISVSYFISILTMFISFLFFVIITDNLSISEYGILSLFLTFITILSNFFSFNLKDFFIKELSHLSTKIKLKKIKSITFPSYLLSLLFLTFIYILKEPLLITLNLENYENLFILSLFISFIKIIRRPITNFLITEKMLNIQNIYAFLVTKGWMVIIILYVLSYNNISLEEIFLIHLLSVGFLLIIGIIFFMKVFKTNIFLSLKLKTKQLKKALTYSLPLTTLIITQWFITASDRYFIKYYHTSISVGNYSYIYSLLLFIVSTSLVLLNILYPYLAEQFNKNRNYFNILFNKCIKYTFLITLPMLFGFFILSDELITMISGEKYLHALSILPILIFFPLIQVGIEILNKPLLLKGKTKKIAKIFLIGMFANIFLNYLLIPRLDYYGASIATVLSYLIMLLLFYNSSKEHFAIDTREINIFKIIISCLIMVSIINLFVPTNNFNKISLILLGVITYIISITLLGIVDKKEIMLIKKLIKKN